MGPVLRKNKQGIELRGNVPHEATAKENVVGILKHIHPFNIQPIFGKGFNNSLISGIEKDRSTLFIPPFVKYLGVRH